MAENPILNDRYRLIEQIGSGGMAVLYKAQDLELGRMVAIKVLRPSLVGDPEFLVRFKREARSAANLSHPNIVTVHDVGQDGPKTHYIVMEYVPGQNLKQLIRAKGAFEVDAALAIIVEVCKGVGYAHRAGLIHCDVKSQNILVTPDNSIKVTDFGIARALSPTQSEELDDVVWGSPHYFSPEQAAGEAPTPASDVYSIGIVLFELLTGALPFTGDDYRALAMAHFTQEAPSIMSVNPALPQELDRIIRKVLSKEPAARYRTADQLGRILSKYKEEGQAPTASFIVRPSQSTLPADGGQQAPPAKSSAPPDARAGLSAHAQPTTPGLPPLDIEAIRKERAAQYAAAQQDVYYEEPAYDDESYDYAEYEIDEPQAPGFDFYGLVLWMLAAVAVLGLIPLWVTVYLTFTR